MEDINSFIWLGIAVFWFLAKLVRRGAKKVVEAQKSPPRPQAPGTMTAETPIESQRFAVDPADQSPSPIVPR